MPDATLSELDRDIFEDIIASIDIDWAEREKTVEKRRRRRRSMEPRADEGVTW